MTRCFSQSLAALMVLLCAPAWPQPVTLLGPGLEPVRGTLRGVSGGGFELMDRQGRAQAHAADEVLRVMFATPIDPRLQQGRVVARLTDGQVLVGKLLGAAAGGGSIRLAVLGDQDNTITLPLDDLLSITLAPGAQAPAARDDDDRVLLATGERLVGFVEAFTDDAVLFIVGDADEPIELPLSRVHALSIANKPAPTPAGPDRRLMRVGLQDGSVLVLEDVKTATRTDRMERVVQGRSPLALSAPQVAFPLGAVVSIEPVSARYALLPLADQAWALAAGGEVFGVPLPPRAGQDGSLHLHAPSTLRFDLPGNAGRLVFGVALELDERVSAHRRALAGCELVVRERGEVIGGCTLEPGLAVQRLNLPLRGGPVEIELKPGVNGPVLDRVRLTDAEVLLVAR